MDQNLENLFNAQLKALKIQKRWINRPKHAENKRVIASRLLNYMVGNNYTKGKSEKALRELGLKLSNAQIRQIYDTIKPPKKQSSYAAKLRDDFKPDENKIPSMRFNRKPIEGFFYAAKVYYYDPDVKKRVKLFPKGKKYIKVGANRGYNIIRDVGFWSEDLLTKREAINIFIYLLTGENEDDDIMDYAFTGSDKMQGGNGQIIGFTYDRTLRG